jgi:hypothetical protein
MEETTMEKRIDDLAGRVGRFEGRFERFEEKVDAKFERVDARFDQMATKADLVRIEKRLDKWGRSVAGAAGAIAVAAILKFLGL